jgi:hypothetical protein
MKKKGSSRHKRRHKKTTAMVNVATKGNQNRTNPMQVRSMLVRPA